MIRYVITLWMYAMNKRYFIFNKIRTKCQISKSWRHVLLAPVFIH